MINKKKEKINSQKIAKYLFWPIKSVIKWWNDTAANYQFLISISQTKRKREEKGQRYTIARFWEGKPKKLIIYSRLNAYHAELAIYFMPKRPNNNKNKRNRKAIIKARNHQNNNHNNNNNSLTRSTTRPRKQLEIQKKK